MRANGAPRLAPERDAYVESAVRLIAPQHSGIFSLATISGAQLHIHGSERPADNPEYPRFQKGLAGVAMKSKTKSTNSHDIEVGQRIRARRMVKGMSQTELGNVLGVTFQQVQKYEKGLNRVGAGRLVGAAEALDVPVSFFFGSTDSNAGAEDTRAILGFLDTSYSLRLLRAFSRIPQPQVQRAVVALIESIAPPA